MQPTNSSIEIDEPHNIPRREESAQALEQILSNGLPALYRQAYRLLGNQADAEDAVQDALLAAYTHLDQFKGQSQTSTWVISIVRNSARMKLRTRRRHIYVPLDEPTEAANTISVSDRLADTRPNPEELCTGAELSTRLTRFYRQLSPTLRTTLHLRAIKGLSIRETAQILGMPHGTVKAQLARARQKLKELMRRPKLRSPDRPFAKPRNEAVKTNP